MNSPTVSIIILNFNGGKHLEECLDSIFNSKFNDFEVLLIDNNSQDNSAKICKEKFPAILLIENDKNEGMSARNIGIKKAKGEFLVFLDSDTIVSQNWLISFIESYRKNGEGLYGPKILQKGASEIIDSAGNMINLFGLSYAHGKGKKDQGQYDNFMKINYPAGACIFTSKEIVNQIGKFDKIFFAYHDDVDFGWRAALYGISSFYEPKVIIYHLSSSVLKWSKKKFLLLERNRWICLLSIYSTKTLIKIFPFLIILEFGMFFYFLTKRMGITKLKSFFSLVKLLPRIRKRRVEINSKRKIDDKLIIKNFVDDFQLPTYLEDKRTSQANKFITNLCKSARTVI